MTLQTCLQACSQQQLTSVLLNSPLVAASWAPTLCRCFAFERSAAALLMYNTSQAGPHASLGGPGLGPSTPTQPPNKDHFHESHQKAAATETYGANQSFRPDKPTSISPSSESTESEQAKAREGGAAGNPNPTPNPIPYPGPTPSTQPAPAVTGASDDSIQLASVVLPRMPLGLKHITTPTAYTAVADVARALGRCSATAGCERHTHSGWPLGPHPCMPLVGGIVHCVQCYKLYRSIADLKM